MAAGVVHRAGPADQVFGSTHVRLKVVDQTDGKDDLFLLYLHLDSIAEGVIPGAPVKQGDIIGAVGQEDATYPHLHFEFRKGEEPKQENSVHPLRYLDYPNKANFTDLSLDRCNFYRRDDGDKRMVRLRFAVVNRREGDVQGVNVEMKGDGVEAQQVHVNFDDRETINSDKGDDQAFKNGIAVEGYQKSNLKGDGLKDLHYGVLIEDITPEYDSLTLQVLDVKNEKPKSAELFLPKLEAGKKPVTSRAGFEEEETFPPPGWTLSVLSSNICRPDEAAKLNKARGLLCQDLGLARGGLIRAGLRFALPIDRAVRPMSWRLRADIKPVKMEMDEGSVIHPLAFLVGDGLVAAACLRKIKNDKLIAGVLIRSTDGLLRERIDVSEGEVFRNESVRCELDLIRLSTRQTTGVVRINENVIARVNGDTTNIEPNAACVGILHRHSGLQITLHVDELRLTEAPRKFG